MKLFIDSADIDEIRDVLDKGVLDGVTTNPSLIKKAVTKHKRGEKLDMDSYICKILKLMKGKSVSLEVVGKTYDEMVSEGLILYNKFNSIAKNVYVKIPVDPSFDGKNNNEDGIKAIRTLSKKGIPVNCTLIFTPEQALMAAKAGAKIVSPFLGREDDFIRKNGKVKFAKTNYFPAEGLKKGKKMLEDNGIVSGVDLLAQIVWIFRKNGIECEILAASIRSPRQFRDSVLAGADIVTVPYSVINKLLVHNKTIEGMKQFTKDIVPEYAAILRSKKK